MKKTFIGILVLTSLCSYAKIESVQGTSNSPLLAKYRIQYKSNKEIEKLKKETLALNSKAVPSLIKIMKDGSFPDKNRWVATFLLGRIMGKKSAPFISKFTEHPSWVMRMASLKTLLALKDQRYSETYIKLLKDKSMLVRTQALSNINELAITKAAPHVWSMLYDKRNYHENMKGKKSLKRMHIVKKVIRTVGDLKFKKATKPLLTMIQKKKYEDIFEEVNYALSKIEGLKAPTGNKKSIRRFWKKKSISLISI